MEKNIKQRIEDLSTRHKIEIVSFGGGGLIILVALALYIQGLQTVSVSLFIGGLITAFLPYGIYDYFRQRRYSQMEQELPLFLRNVSEGVKGGMSLPQAFQQAAETDYGKINQEVERSAHQLSWGIPFPEVMRRFSERVEGSGLMRRSISIILQSYESGGDIAGTLDSIASNASRIKEAEKERQSVLKQQVYVIYAIHFLFVGIVITVYLMLDNFLIGIGGGGGLMGEVPNFCSPAGPSIAEPVCSLCPAFGLGSAGSKMCYYKSLFLLMIGIEGVFNGLVIGEVTQGRVTSGVRHSVGMATVGLIIYLLVITVL